MLNLNTIDLLFDVIIIAVCCFLLIIQGQLIKTVLIQLRLFVLAVVTVLIPILGYVLAHYLRHGNDPREAAEYASVGTIVAGLLYLGVAALFYTHGGNLCLSLRRDLGRFRFYRKNLWGIEMLEEGPLVDALSVDIEVAPTAGKYEAYNRYYLTIHENRSNPGKRTLFFYALERAEKAKARVEDFLRVRTAQPLELCERQAIGGAVFYGFLGVCCWIFGPK
jgi:hypothetical protein